MNIGPYIRSAYTLLDSLITFDDLAKRAKERDYGILALVDRNMHGALAFKKVMAFYDIKAVFGLEIPYIIKDVKDTIIVYAKNDVGYSALYKLSTLVNAKDTIIDRSILLAYLDDLVIVIPSSSHFFDIFDINLLKAEFADFYLGIIHNDYRHQKEKNDLIKKKAAVSAIKAIALYNAFYLDKEDEHAYRALKAIKEKTTIDDKDLIVETGVHLYDTEEIYRYYEYEDIRELNRLFKDLVFRPVLAKSELPDYPCPHGYAQNDYLINLAKAGLSKRLKGNVSEEYRDRLNDELRVIIKMGFTSYFLIVYDFVLYAKRHGIMVGPGRGSAAGSLVAYCLGITDIDPLEYGLIFERFLNPERVSMPDIDIDFPDDRRDEVIDYVKERYGKDHVAHILTYGTLKTKQVLRDVARVLSYEGIDSLCRLIPSERMTLKEAFKEAKGFRERIKADAKAEELYSLSLKLEGLPRHYSTHAAGIVLSKVKLDDVVPLVKIEDDMYSVTFSTSDLEDLGLIKMDLLGLRNLSVISEIVDDVKKVDKDFSIQKIALDDKKTYDLIASVDTLGIFQLESSGMQKIIRDMRPATFIDIATTIALYRPGPMQNIPLYLANRQDPTAIRYLHPSLRPILEETSGIIIYQEQIMQIARSLAGFSMAKADILRRAMAKKDEKLLVSLKEEFITGAIANDIKRDIAEQIYDLIMKFANYGFNKSHSVAYALIAYEEAYLKANYPLYFYKALLTGVISSFNKTYEYIAECKRRGIKIKGPDILLSYDSYTIEDDALRMPLSIIKNVGSVSIRTIIEEREKGAFKSYLETVGRLKSIGKNAIEALIDAGAFDCFRMSRKKMRINLADALKVDVGMFLDDPSMMMVLEEADDDIKEKYQREKEVFGFAFSIDPLENFKKRYGLDLVPIYRLKTQKGRIKGIGEVKKVRTITDKRGQKMAFMTVGDDTDTIDLVIFSRLYSQVMSIILNSKGKYVIFDGEIDKNSVKVEHIEVKE